MKAILRLLLAATLLFPGSARAATFISTWNSTTGNWNDATRWNTAAFPNNAGGTTYDGVVNGGAVTLNQHITIQKYSHGGSAVLTSSTASRLTLNELFTWVGNPSFSTIGGNVILQCNAGILFSGGGDRVVGGATSGSSTITIAGTTTFNTGALYIAGTSAVSNSGTFNITGNAGIAGAISGSQDGTFTSTGVINKSGASTTSSIQLTFNKSNTVNITSGTLSIGGAGSDSGSYNVSSTAGLGFYGNRTIGSSISGAGDVTFGTIGTGQVTISGAYNVTGKTNISGKVDFGGSASTGPLDISGTSAVRGGTGSLTASGVFTWNGGQLVDGGTTTANGGMTLSGGSTRTVGDATGARLINNGTATHSAGNLQIGNNSSELLNNGTYNMTSSVNIMSGVGGGVAGRVTNEGNFNKNGSSNVSQIGVPFFNNNIVTLTVGTLELNAGGTATDASFVVNNSSILDFGGGAHVLNAGTSITTGSSATLRCSGGTAIANRALTLSGIIQVNGGALTLVNNSSCRILTLSAGERLGNGNLTVSQGIDWSGGALGGDSITTVSSTSTLTGSANKMLGVGGAGSTRLTNNGTMTWSTGNLIINKQSSSGALLTNNGTFNATNNGAINLGTAAGASGRFINNGTFNKTGSGTTTTIAVPYTGGTANVNEGTLAFTDTYNHTGGVLFLNGGNVSTTNVLNIQSGGTIMGTGTISGDVANSGTIAPGASAGQLAITGDLTLGSTAQLAIELGGTTQGVSYDTISEAGSAPLTLDGALALTFIDGFQNTITNSNAFTILSSSMPITGAFTNVASGGRLTTTDGFGSFRVTYAGANAVVLSDFQSLAFQLTQAGSRKTHGTAGTFDIDLPLTGTRGVECRSSNGSHTLVFTFSDPVVSGSASVTAGTGSVSGNPSFSGNTMTVNLTDVTDAQDLKVTLSSVTSASAQTLPSAEVTMGVLLGDSNGSGGVTSADIGQTKAQSGSPVTASNARQDLNVSGGISSADIGLVKSRSGASIPPASSPDGAPSRAVSQ